jgi:hypothetical protein
MWNIRDEDEQEQDFEDFEQDEGHSKQRGGSSDTDSTSTSSSSTRLEVKGRRRWLRKSDHCHANENESEDSSSFDDDSHDIDADNHTNKRKHNTKRLTTFKIHCHLWPYGRLPTITALTLASIALTLSVLARRSTSFATLESGNGYGLITKEDMYLPLTRVGLFRIQVCELQEELNDDQTLSGGTTPYRIEVVEQPPSLFEPSLDNVGPCHTKELLHAEINDSLWDASCVASTCGLLLGTTTLVMLLSATIIKCSPSPPSSPKRANLRAMALLALGAYFCQTLTFIIFGSDMCYQLGCSLSVGASYAVASSILWFGTGICLFIMYLRQRRERGHYAGDEEEEHEDDDPSEDDTEEEEGKSDHNDKQEHEHGHGPQYDNHVDDGWVIPSLLDDNDNTLSMSTSTDDDDGDDGCYNGACSPRSVAVAHSIWSRLPALPSSHHCAATLCLELGQDEDHEQEQDQDRPYKHGYGTPSADSSNTRTNNSFEPRCGTGLYEC